MEFDLAGSGMRFAPGDSLGLLPTNEARLVDALIQRLGWDGGQAFAVRSADGADSAARLLAHLRWPCTLRDALLYGCDVTSVPRCVCTLCVCILNGTLQSCLAAKASCTALLHQQECASCPNVHA